ncbi:MAG: hypothetical protein K0Q49_146 [Haloplasmataceae bacterium]|jgi:hypothetical protein|nr:hypothetical protein [Haloplasmataceae bacterium]
MKKYIDGLSFFEFILFILLSLFIGIYIILFT